MSVETTQITITISNVPKNIWTVVLHRLARQALKAHGEVVDLSSDIQLDYLTMEDQNFYDCVGAAITQQAIDTSKRNAN